jgi:hypothetical protein
MKFMLATRVRIAFALLLLTVGFASAASAAATSDFKIYLDLDNDQATGCPLLPTLSASFTTAEEILDVTVNVGATRSIAGVTRLVCNPSTHLFVAGTAPAAAIGQGLGTPVGATPSDVIETALPLTGTGAGKQVRIGFTSIFNGNNATDQLLTLNGTPGGAPITVQLIPDVPALGSWGLLLLALLLTGSACLMIRRRGHRRAALLLLVLALSGGIAWAAGLVVDGNPADWTGIAATIATDVPGDAAANADIVKAFAALQTNTLYLRIDALFETLPTGVDDTYSTLEDTQLSVPAPGVLANDTGDNLVATAQTAAPTAQAGTVTLQTTGAFVYTPAAGFVGSDSFPYTVTNSSGTSNATVTITVTPVNHAPSFTKGADQTVLEDAGPQTVAGWATAISPGPANESGQTVSFQVTADTNAALFSTPPAVDSTGTLTYTPAADANGTATITLVAKDDGGTANGGVDTSAPQTFVINVTPVNDAPSFTKGADQTVLENAGAQTVNPWATAISPGPADESGQTVAFNVTANTNSALFSVAPAISPTGVLTYTPATDQFGTATITLDLQDNGGTANGGVDTSAPQTFVITVTNINHAPSFTKGADQTVLEDAGPQTVPNWATAISAGTNESGQTVTFQVTNNTNAALFSAAPAISPTGTLTYTPAANANGTATITIDLKDDGGTANGGVDTSPTQTFVITVTAVNDAPSFTKGADQTVLENAGPQTVNPWATAVSAGPPDESTQTLTFQVTANTNAALFAAGPAVSSTGVLTYTPATNTFGTATITIDLKDNGGTANGGVDTSATQTFVINVTNVNQPPSFTKGPDVTVLEDAGPQTISPWATAISPGPGEGAQTVAFQVTGDTNAALFSTAPAVSPTGVLTFTAAANANGTATITLVLKDNGGTANGGVDTSAAQTFVINVTAVNDVPSFTKGADQTVLENAGPQTVNGWATAISAGPPDESAQTLTFQVTGNTNAALFAAGPAVSSTGVLTFTPATNTFGTATITIDLKDNGGTANGGVDTSATQTFVINVTNVNQPPSFTKGADQTVLEDAGAQTVNPWATAISPGPGEGAQTVTFQVTGNTNAALFATGPAVSSTGVLTYTPAANANGTAAITLVLHDNGGTANGGVDTSAAQTFNITVTAVNDAPSFTKGPDQTVLENAGAQTVNPWATAISPGPANEAGQTVTFMVTGNTNAALFAVPPAVSSTGVLTFTPATNAFGSATITLVLKDNGGTANGGVDTSAAQTFVINVSLVNQAPSFTKGPDQTTLENSGAQTVSPWATAISPGPASESGQTVAFNITGDTNPTLFSAGPAVSPTGVLTYTPAAGMFGTATITLVLMDNGGTANGGVDTSAPQTFTITLTQVNQAPSFTKGPDVTVLEDAGPQSMAWATAISPGPASESGQTVHFNITGDTNAALFSAAPAVSATGVLTFTPAANANGTATITLTLQDNGGTANGGVDTSAAQSFVITVTSVNDQPSFTKGPDQNVNDNVGAITVSPWATAISAGPADESGQTLTFIITGDTDPTIFATAPAVSPTGVLTYTPAIVPTGTHSSTISLVLKDNGGTANGGVDTSITQTFVIAITHVNVAPSLVATPKETFDTVGNTQLQFAAASSVATPSIFVTGNLVANFTDSDGPSALSAVAINGGATTNGGTVTVTANGEFIYTPKAGDTAASDSFSYQVTDGAATVTRTVTINLKSRAWYVKNNAAAGGLGRSNDPFKTLAAAQTASLAGDYIFVYGGDQTNTGQAAGFVLKANQKLYGEAFGLTIANTVNGVVNPTLVAANTANRPVIDNTTASSDGISATNISGVEVRGVSVSGTQDAVDLTTNGGNSGGIVITDNIIRQPGIDGIHVAAGGTGAVTVAISNNNIAGNVRGMNLLKTAGTMTITDLSNNAITGPGSGIVVDGAIFDATPGNPINTISGGTTSIGSSATPMGAAGVSLTNVTGDVSFTDLDIYNSAGTGLRVASTGALNAASGTGFRLAVGSGVGTIDSNGGPAIDVSNASINLPLLSFLRSTNSTTTGVSLVNAFGGVGGTTLSAPSGQVADPVGGSGTAFVVDGGNGGVSFGGPIFGTSGLDVSVTNRTSDTVSFSGAITDNAGAGSGISLTSNTGGTISFTGTLNLSTGANAAFTATGGGTVTATDTSSTLTTTTGTALNVANTTIGAGGLKFASVSAGTAASGPANGIVLNNTGAGGLTIAGGTIQKTTSNGISLTTTGPISLSSMTIKNSTHLGINGTGVAGFTLSNSSVLNNGTSANVDHGIQLLDVSGAAAFTNDTVTGSHVTNLFFGGTVSSTVTTNSLTVSGGTYGNSATNSGIQVNMTHTSTLKTALISGVTFSSNASSGLQMVSNDNSIVGDGAGAPASGTVTVSGCTFTNNAGNTAMDIDQGGGGGAGQMYARLINNTTITGNGGPAINIFTSSSSTGGTMKVRIDGNHVGNAAVSGSGTTLGPGIRVFLQGKTTNTVTIANNVVRQTLGSRAIDVEALGPVTTGQPITVSDVVITGNDAATNDTTPGGSLAAIYVAADDQGSPAQINAEIHGNTIPTGGDFDYPTFDGNAPWLYYRVATAGAVAKLFNFGGHANANSEIQLTQASGTAGADITNNGGVQLTGVAVNSIP